MDTIVLDIAKSVRWVHDRIAARVGDPKRIFLMGHSAGAQLAALVCNDDRFLKSEGLSLAILKGCVPVDGDTYDVPLQVATAAARRKNLGRLTRGSGIQRSSDLLIASATSPLSGMLRAISRFRRSLSCMWPTTPTPPPKRIDCGANFRKRECQRKYFGAAGTDHVGLDRQLGVPGDPSTGELFAFVEAALKK